MGVLSHTEKIQREVIRIRKSKKYKQWQKEKVQNDKQRSTKHTHKTQDGVTRIPLTTEGEFAFLPVFEHNFQVRLFSNSE